MNASKYEFTFGRLLLCIFWPLALIVIIGGAIWMWLKMWTQVFDRDNPDMTFFAD